MMKQLSARRYASVCIVTVILSALDGSPAIAADPASPIEFLQSEMQKQQIPGAQLAVVKDGRLVTLGAFGLASIEHDVPVTNEYTFAINSCTKAFTGVALMQLVDDGLLSLDAPISRYLADLPQAWQAVTVRQMATNTSGLPEYWLETHMLVDGDLDATWEKLKTLPMPFAPGTRTQYNQTNWLLLQRIIEKLSGKPYAQFVTERQFNVVGMPVTARAGWSDDVTIVPRLAQVYSNIRNERKTDDWGNFPGRNFVVTTRKLVRQDGVHFPASHNAGSGLSSNAQELARWALAVQSGKLLSPASLKELWTAAVLKDGSRGTWGIGWPVSDRKEHPVILPSGGGRSAFAVYPQDGVIVVLLTNLLGAWPDRLLDGIAAYYVSDPGMLRSEGFGLPDRLKAFHKDLGRRGVTVENVTAAVADFRRDNPSFGSVDDLRYYALYLFWSAQYEESIQVLRANAQLYPQSAMAAEILAAVYQLNGYDAEAAQAHRRALELKKAKNVR